MSGAAASEGRAERRLAAGQGLFYAATGLWPILHLRSFEAVTGPKRERWLVRTVGVLVAVVGGTLVFAARRGRIGPELRLLAGASAAGLAAIDGWYAGVRRRIAPVYLADAAAEVLLAAAWATGALRTARAEGEP